MKKVVRTLAVAAILAVSLTSCRDENKETKTVEGVEVSKDADIDVSDDGKKIKIEDGETDVKIKRDEDGNIEKKKIETENTKYKVKKEDGEVTKEKMKVDK